MHWPPLLLSVQIGLHPMTKPSVYISIYCFGVQSPGCALASTFAVRTGRSLPSGRAWRSNYYSVVVVIKLVVVVMVCCTSLSVSLELSAAIQSTVSEIISAMSLLLDLLWSTSVHSLQHPNNCMTLVLC